jgi:hypothetical protein
MQALLFPLSADELQAKGKEMAALELKFEQLAEEKDTKSREYNEELKKLRGQILRLSKEIDEEQARRDPTDEEAPWQGLMDQAQDRAGRRGPKRDRTGEYPDEDA